MIMVVLSKGMLRMEATMRRPGGLKKKEWAGVAWLYINVSGRGWARYGIGIML
jgi:hypothetical protein